MDALVYKCPQCGASVDIDSKTKRGTCDFCGCVVRMPRKEFNSVEQVAGQWKIVRRSFADKAYTEALEHANSILRFSTDYVPALFVRAYYYAFVAPVRQERYLQEFFNALKEVEGDDEETAETAALIGSVAVRFGAYEKEILSWACTQLPDKDLRDFVETFCPVVIMSKKTWDGFTQDVIDLYKDIVTRCGAQKTCYALLQSILKNPDSPFFKGEFFLRTKTKRFYEEYMTPIGEIMSIIPQEDVRNKFSHAYQALHDEILKKMEG